MTNELGQVRCVVQIYTTGGVISIECEPGSTSVSYHYTPLSREDSHYCHAVPLDSPELVREALSRSRIEPTYWNVEQIEKAIRTVRAMAGSFNV